MSLASIWSQCLCEFLSPSIGYQLTKLQFGISQFLDELQPMMRRSKEFAQHLREVFLPVLDEIKDKEGRSQAIEQTLVVNTNRIF